MSPQESGAAGQPNWHPEELAPLPDPRAELPAVEGDPWAGMPAQVPDAEVHQGPLESAYQVEAQLVPDDTEGKQPEVGSPAYTAKAREGVTVSLAPNPAAVAEGYPVKGVTVELPAGDASRPPAGWGIRPS